MSDVAIRVENLGKKYRIGGPQARYKTFRETLVDVAKVPVNLARSAVRGHRADGGDNEIWALRDVSFEVKHGEVIGIIGRNGAGKSTLLKILTRITEPTEGLVKIHGRVGSLLEVGTGFHPELTGRENIYLNGAILGMRREEIDRKFDEIVDFSGIEKFLDTPVKRYSSGMQVRLAFSVAAHLEPEILLVDEVLAVGDAIFQKKCLGKMENVAQEGRTVLFVSHNMAMVSAICERGLLIHHGRIIRDDVISRVVQDYLSVINEHPSIIELRDRVDRSGDGSVRAARVRFGTGVDPQGGYWTTGEDAILILDYECSDDRAYPNIEAAVGVRRLDQTPLLYLGTKVVRENIEAVQGSGEFSCHIKRLPLEPGSYSIITEIKQNGIIVDRVEAAATVNVTEGDFYGTGVIWPYSGFLCDYSWSHLDEISNQEIH